MATNAAIRITPSVLAADFSRLGEQVALVEQAGADWLHLDIMDGHFVPNLSIGVPVVASIRKVTSLHLDVHLMLTDPGKYAEPFVKAGADTVTFHIEAVDDAPAMVEQLRGLGVGVGVSLNPGTPADAARQIVPMVDLVLVMTVWPGFGGQKFMPECLDKIRTLAGWMNAEQTLQVDGGIDTTTAPLVAGAGANNLVAGSAVFGATQPGAALKELRRVAADAAQRRALEQRV
ncbi:MAG: ribulose-phosphate 3-epimerase [Phycisphaerae bacterium]|nr:ribulose-phosphate 3-epimerase [Phycisphaerae bacterium]